tara:strand:+ start:107 stop:640 length:534 start_codon:yes stop_codon:yes gene_type:complete
MNKRIKTIYLIGYMGAGKTLIGRSISKKISFNFYDLDSYIELKEGKKVSEIFNEKNEVYFRKIENKYLNELSNKNEKKIISTGGGTPCFENNQSIIQNSPDSVSIYLKAKIETLAKRLIKSLDKRPIISHLSNENELKSFITKHLFERSFYYEKSDIKIKTDNIELKDIIKLIQDLV